MYRAAGRHRGRPSIGTVGLKFRQCPGRIRERTFKTELLCNPAALERNGGPWKGLTNLELAMCAWVEGFNGRRLHGELASCTPVAVKSAYDASHPHAAVT